MLVLMAATSLVPPAHAQELQDPEPYSPGASLAYSLLTTTLGYGFIVASVPLQNSGLFFLGFGGSVVGPSVGHLWTGDTKRALVPIAIRTAGMGMLYMGANATLGCIGDVGPCNSGSANSLMLGGLVITAGATIYSIIDAPAAARRANRRHQERLLITPAPIAGPGRSMGMGLSVTGSF